MISVPISADDSIVAARARSPFRILPRSGRMAWLLRSRPCFAEPPAESPSTRKISDFAGSRSWQSASLPGRLAISITPLRRVRSRAFRAASRAAAASKAFEMILRASAGCSSNHWLRQLATAESTTGFTSEETSLSFVCDENLGSGTFTETMAVSPSRESSPVSATFSRFAIPEDWA